MVKIASIDIGTNTVLMLVAEISSTELNVIHEMHSIPRIGKGVAGGGTISEEKIALLILILEEYKRKALELGCLTIIPVGTNALRIASNAKEVIDRVYTETGLMIKVISGTDEARMSYLGATSFRGKNKYMVIDIGGGSTEIIVGRHEEIIDSISLPIGVVTLTEIFGQKGIPTFPSISKITDYLQKVFEQSNIKSTGEEVTIAVAGTPTTLAAIKLGLSAYSEDAIEGQILMPAELYTFSEKLNSMSPEQILYTYPIVQGREDVILAGNIILLNICKLLNLNKVIVSTRGLRYGVVIDYFLKNLKT